MRRTGPWGLPFVATLMALSAAAFAPVIDALGWVAHTRPLRSYPRRSTDRTRPLRRNRLHLRRRVRRRHRRAA